MNPTTRVEIGKTFFYSGLTRSEPSFLWGEKFPAEDGEQNGFKKINDVHEYGFTTGSVSGKWILSVLLLKIRL